MASFLESRLWRLLVQRQCILRHFTASSCSAQQTQAERRTVTKDTPVTPERNPLPLFLDPKVQSLLKSLDSLNIRKITSPRLVKHSEKPSYQFMTGAEVEQAKQKVIEHSEELMQMPPYMSPREEINEVLSRDPDIAPCLDSKFVFTDISHGVKDRDRIIVVRDEDGTLRQAHWDERDRMNQLYNPQLGRSVVVPMFFEDDNIRRLLTANEHRYVLDKACVQFEPDDERFIHVYRMVYNDLMRNDSFEMLSSTRYYGHMIFDAVWTNRTDKLLIHYLSQRNKFSYIMRIVNLGNYLYGRTESLQHQTYVDRVVLVGQIKAYLDTLPNTKARDKLFTWLKENEKDKKIKDEINSDMEELSSQHNTEGKVKEELNKDDEE